IFDTQVAAMVLGHGDSVSYDQLVQRLTGDQIDKSLRFTDWSRRPLSHAQLNYAVPDVTHPRDGHLKLSADPARGKRSDWVQAEGAWEGLKARVRGPKELAVLMEVAAWREREAQSRDVPRQRVIKDDAVMEIAQQQPKTVEELGRLRALPKGFERSRAGEQII